MAIPLKDLRRLLVARLVLDEVKTICFDMSLSHEHLAGETIGAKVRELLDLCHRTHRLAELLATIREVRPDLMTDLEAPMEPTRRRS